MRIEVPENISRPFIYACMGFGSNSPDERSVALVEECSKLVLDAAEPRLIYKEFNMTDVEVFLEGEDIKEHLADADRCVMMALTLGSQIDRLIRRYEITDMVKAMAIDACASSLVEDLCDRFSGELAERCRTEGSYTTSRFSPGYGDLPLNAQKVFEHLLEMHRAIGLSHSKEFLLTPRKSVTAIIGICKSGKKSVDCESQKIGLKKPYACEICKNYENCAFRLKGAHCGR